LGLAVLEFRLTMGKSSPWILPDRFEDRLVIFGAGGMGRKIRQALAGIGCCPLAFCDNNSQIWDKEIEGVRVLSPAAAVAAFPKAVFMVAIWHPSRTEGLRRRVEELQKLGCQEVTCFIPLFWKYPDLFLPNMFWEVPGRLSGQESRIAAARELLDDLGRAEFDRQLAFHRSGDFFALGEPEPGEQYFPSDIVKLSGQETFVDCGAYDGDTLRDFLLHSQGSFRKVLALEPDAENFKKLANSSNDDRVVTLQYAVGARRELLRISSSGPSSSISSSGSIEIQCVTLDELLADEEPTFIKMDIEGSEIDALKGAQKTLKRCRPRLAVCVYHHPDHLWSIPLLLNELVPESRLTIRSHMLDGFDTVCYCLPQS